MTFHWKPKFVMKKKLNKTVEGTQQKRTVSLAEAVSRQGMN